MDQPVNRGKTMLNCDFLSLIYARAYVKSNVVTKAWSPEPAILVAAFLTHLLKLLANKSTNKPHSRSPTRQRRRRSWCQLHYRWKRTNIPSTTISQPVALRYADDTWSSSNWSEDGLAPVRARSRDRLIRIRACTRPSHVTSCTRIPFSASWRSNRTRRTSTQLVGRRLQRRPLSSRRQSLQTKARGLNEKSVVIICTQTGVYTGWGNTIFATKQTGRVLLRRPVYQVLNSSDQMLLKNKTQSRN